MTVRYIGLAWVDDLHDCQINEISVSMVLLFIAKSKSVYKLMIRNKTKLLHFVKNRAFLLNNYCLCKVHSTGESEPKMSNWLAYKENFVQG